MEDVDQARWFSGVFTTADAERVLVSWEKGMDEQEDDDWRGFINTTYEEYLLGSDKCDGRDSTNRDTVRGGEGRG